jgi:DNA repair protein RecO (recombination protein O)
MTTSSRDSHLTPAYILHSRRYRDTSLLVDLFTARDGRISAIVRGGGKAGSNFAQAFSPLLISYRGRGELKTTTKIEVLSGSNLSGNNLFVGMYVNELLVRLLGKFDAMPDLFESYQGLLETLSSTGQISRQLRAFEFLLIAELGYGLTFDVEAGGNQAIEHQLFYRFVANQGFYLAKADTPHTYCGSHLLALARGSLDSPGVDSTAKQIIRSSFDHLLGGKLLKSRSLFRQFNKH